MYKTLLLDENIWEILHKAIEEDSDAKNLTADNFSRIYNTQRENAKAIFTIERLDKLDELADTIKDLTINEHDIMYQTL